MSLKNRSRILIVTRNLPPLVGGMERLNWHIADQLSRYAEVRVIGPAGSRAGSPVDVEIIEVPLQPLWRFLSAATWRATGIARSWKPDIVLAGSGVTAPIALIAASVSGARSGVYLHGLDIAVQHPLYSAVWVPAIRRMHTVIANSRHTATLANTLGVTSTQMRILHPGVRIPAERQAPHVLAAFRERHGLADARILLSVGRLTTRKGLREFVQHALPRIVEAAPDTLLVIIGDTPDHALHARAQTRRSIQEAADSSGVGKDIRFLGVITDQTELACAYETASAHVFPLRTLPGDPEGFGMVAIEAAAHGLPTVAFASGGVLDAVDEGVSGHLVAPGDYPAFATAVLTVLGAPLSRWQTPASSFARKFDWPVFGEKLKLTLLETVEDDLSPTRHPEQKCPTR